MTGHDAARARRGAVRPSPLFLAVLAATVLGGVLAQTAQAPGSRTGDIGVFLLVLGGWVVSVCLHEFAHAFAAYRAGDRSVETAGYLTLNPFKYAHPVLSVVLPLIFIVQGGIGLPGGAVYLHRHAFRSRASQSLAAAAGPVTNATLAVVLLALARQHSAEVFALFSTGAAGPARLWSGIAFLGFLQVTAAVLNLLPVPGLDGWAIVEPYVSPELRRGAEAVKPWGLLGVILLLQINSLSDAFFSLVDRLYHATGADPDLWKLGWRFFRFWTKNPA